MDRPRLNLLKVNISKEVNKAEEYIEEDFWKYYLTIVNLKDDSLSKTQIKVLAYVLSKDEDKEYFQGNKSAQVVRYLNTSKQQFWNHKQALLKKGYLVKKDKKYYLENNLKALQRFIKKIKNKKQEIEFILPFKIK